MDITRYVPLTVFLDEFQFPTLRKTDQDELEKMIAFKYKQLHKVHPWNRKIAIRRMGTKEIKEEYVDETDQYRVIDPLTGVPSILARKKWRTTCVPTTRIYRRWRSTYHPRIDRGWINDMISAFLDTRVEDYVLSSV